MCTHNTCVYNVMDTNNSVLYRFNAIKIQKFIKKNITKCDICFEFKKKFLKPYKCVHSICESCFSQWNYKCNTCPTCRGDILDNFNNRKQFKLNNILVSSRNNFDYGLVPRNFRPRSPIYSPPISISDENSFTPIRDNLPENNSNLDYDLLNAFVD